MLSFSSYIYLDEARISPEALAKIHPSINTEHDLAAPHRDSSDIINHFANNADPTNEKIYTPWLVNKYKAQTFMQNDAPDIKQTLSDFHANKNRMPIKDINQYKSPDELKQAVAPFIGSKSGKQQKKETGEGADLIHAENGVTVHKLNTKEAAMKYGAATKWCTSAKVRNQFNNYNKDGDLYVIKGRNGEKHKLFLSKNGEEKDNELRDAEDNEVPIQDLIKKHPEIKNVQEFKNSKLGFHFASTPEELKTRLYPALENGADPDTQREAFKHPSIDKEYLKKVLKNPLSPDAAVEGAASHPNADKEVIAAALKHPSPRARAQAVANPNATPEQIEKGLNDKSAYVQSHAAGNPKASTEHLEKAFRSSDPTVRASAVSNPKASKELVLKGMADKHHSVNYWAGQHPMVNDAFLKQAMNHKDHNISFGASNIVMRRGMGL
jgi:hypothetical protein